MQHLYLPVSAAWCTGTVHDFKPMSAQRRYKQGSCLSCSADQRWHARQLLAQQHAFEERCGV